MTNYDRRHGKCIVAEVLPSGRKSKTGDEHVVYFQGSEVLKIDTNEAGQATLECYAAGDKAEVYIKVGDGEWREQSFTVPADGSAIKLKL
jgi:hypothetical protein